MLAAAVLVCVVAVSACTRPHPYESLTDQAEPLRTQFNRDAGHPRVVMLVAPT